MKRVATNIISLLLLFVFFTVTASSSVSVIIDGSDTGTEWSEAGTYLIFRGESNSDIDLAIAKYKFYNKESALYICFMFTDSHFSETNGGLGGVSFSIDNSIPFVINTENLSEKYDYENYSFDAAIGFDENNGATCEIRIGLKNGVPASVSCCVKFYDHAGMPSNNYNFILINEEYQTEEIPVYTEKTEKNIEEKAINNTTTDYYTTSRKSQSKSTSYTSYDNDVITENGRLIYTPNYLKDKTTKKATTSEKETTEHKSITLKSPKTSKAPTVVYYIKEVLVTVPVTSYNETSVETVTEEITEINTSDSGVEKTAMMSLSQGYKYKKILLVAAAVLILSLGLFGYLGASKSMKTVESYEESAAKDEDVKEDIKENDDVTDNAEDS